MTGLGECGATKPTIVGRCGRDAGHDGDHRSTGETFTAAWAAHPTCLACVAPASADHACDSCRQMLERDALQEAPH